MLPKTITPSCATIRVNATFAISNEYEKKETIDKLTAKCLPFIRNNALNKPLRWHSGTEKKERNTTQWIGDHLHKNINFLSCFYVFIFISNCVYYVWCDGFFSKLFHNIRFRIALRIFALFPHILPSTSAKQKSIRVHFTSKTIRIEHALSCVSIERTHTTASFQCRVQLVQSTLCERVWCKQ